LSNAEPEIQFDYDKFKLVVHLVCSVVDREELGRTKIHKVLYYSDMLCFLETGSPLTGADYLKQPFGPAARHLGKALAELEAEGGIEIFQRPYFGLTKTDFVVREKPSVGNALSAHEIKLLHEVIGFVCKRSASEISEISHAAPWQSVSAGERIPYFTAFWLLPDLGTSDQKIEAIRADLAQSRKLA
jgi:uncharacterized phage-associated protein